jgi:hypothetical protein
VTPSSSVMSHSLSLAPGVQDGRAATIDREWGPITNKHSRGWVGSPVTQGASSPERAASSGTEL